MPEQRLGSWLQTSTGRVFWPLDPRPTEICIEDIAHALGNLCRYGGHAKRFYSVAEHSVHVSYLVPSQDALCGLMHDAAEAYCVDIPKPVKVALPDYRRVEKRIWKAIAKCFDLPANLPAAVHDADVAMLYAEQAHIMYPCPDGLDFGMGMKSRIKTSGKQIKCLPPEHARDLFLSRFYELQARGSAGK